MPKKQYTIKIEEDLFEKVIKLAEKENRSRNNMFETLLERGFIFEAVDLSKVKVKHSIKGYPIGVKETYEIIDNSVDKVIRKGEEKYIKSNNKIYKISFLEDTPKISYCEDKNIKEDWIIPPGEKFEIRSEKKSWIFEVTYNNRRLNLENIEIKNL